MPWALAERGAGALFFLFAAGLFAWAPRPRASRAAWIALLVPALALGAALNLQPGNCPSANFAHYWLGAKYPVPYADLYRLVRAGQGLPQVGMRDLARPARIVRAGDAEQRAYYLGLLSGAGVAFDSLGSTHELAERARESGAIEEEARRLLAASLPAGRIAAFRRDVGEARRMGQADRLALDYGYNGSPLYGLLRHADPTLYLTFGTLPAWANFAWQLLGVALLAALAGAALGYTLEQKLAVAALLLASRDFVAYALPGLVFTELWLAVALAAWAVRRRRPVVAGVAIAVAGLLKLFPFVLLVPSAARLVLGARRGDPATAAARRPALVLIGACVAATIALAALSQMGGRTWIDFAHKIAAEFQSEANMINSVSLGALFMTFGVSDRSPLLPAVGIAMLAVLAAMFRPRRPEADEGDLPRRMLVLVAAMGLVLKSWLNYYALLPLVLLPHYATRHRMGAVVAALGLALVHALPDFQDPRLVDQPWLHALVLAPPLAIAAWMAWLELSEPRWSPLARRAGWAALAALALATGAEAWRHSVRARLYEQGSAALAAADARVAFERFDALVRTSPRDAVAHRRRAIALAMQGRLEEALPGFARAAALAPDDAAALHDHARALLMLGRVAEAATQLERARAIAPDDVQVLFELARARAALGRIADAQALLERARALAPEEPEIAEALRQLRGE